MSKLNDKLPNCFDVCSFFVITQECELTPHRKNECERLKKRIEIKEKYGL